MTHRHFATFLIFLQPTLACAQRPARADDLLEIIRQDQVKHVPKSTGIWAHHCFTDEDLAQFRSSNQAQKIAEELNKSSRLLAIVAEIGKLDPHRREELFAKARRLRRPTWEEMGFIDSAGNGQTRAGAEAESLIATEILKIVVARLRQPRR